MSDLNHQTLGETPKEYIENEDGSVDIPDLEPVSGDSTEFYANLAESLEESTLDSIASELVELIEKDKEARKKRDQQYEEGIRRTGLGDDAPGGAQFEGASKVVHPVMAEACVDFASSAVKELFPPSGPVRTDYVGVVSKEQRERGERKKEYMNWQMTKQMPEYIDELEQLLSQLPLGGSQYLKVRPDEALKRPIVEFVPIDEILLPYAATSFYTSPRITHRQLITQVVFDQRTDNGFYREINDLGVGETPEQSSAALATDKVEGIDDNAYNEDGLRAILEIYVWREIEDDGHTAGEHAPYVIHIDEHTEKVLAVYRNWDEADTTFEKLDWLVEFKFIPWRGAYAIGLPHLIGGLSAALTGSLRALLDSAHINNAASMLKLKSGRVTGQNTTVSITEVTEIDAPANVDDIRKIAMPMPFNPPSPVLFQLLGFLSDQAKGVVSTSEEKIAEAGNQMPVGTAMALIEQGSKVFSAIHARLHRSQAKVLEILHRINSKWLDVQDQQQKLGKIVATQEDFQGSLDVIPASDPNIFSESQRFAQIQALLQMAGDQRVQWNVQAIYHRMMDLMHVQQPEELLPVPPKPITADPITESAAALANQLIKPELQQDHLSHIQAHLAYLSTPWILQNQMIPVQPLQGLLGHVNEHITMLQMVMVQQVGQQLMQQAQVQGEMVSPEQISAGAVMQANQLLMQQMQPIMQQIQQISQVLQQRTPPPPMPPEVQASLQIAQMETQRKTQYDQAVLQSKQAEQQAAMAMEQAKLQMEAGQQQFEQYQANIQQQMDQRNEELSRQVQLLVNEQDNKHHQMTELLKNRDDNQTQVIIEQMRQSLDAQAKTLADIQTAQQRPSEPQVDIAPQLQQLTGMLDQIGKQQTNDALASVMQGLQATIATLNKPKMIIRDQNGKAQGIQ